MSETPSSTPPFKRIPPSLEAGINNAALITGFMALQNLPDTRKSHFIDGRFENIYLTPKQLPALTPLLDYAHHQASRLLNEACINKPIQRIGHWFNLMPPGSRTSKHDHNEGNELLSGVYYVTVPKNSGDIVLYETTGKAYRYTPNAGEMLFFAPNVPHEVETNHSEQARISIGMNFLAAPNK